MATITYYGYNMDYFRSIMRRFGSISCLVYDNGRPDQKEVSLKEIITDRLLLPSTDAAVTSDYMCMGAYLDCTTKISEATFVYCVQPYASPSIFL